MEAVLFIFMAVGLLPSAILYIYDIITKRDKQIAIANFNFTILVVGLSPLVAFVLFFLAGLLLILADLIGLGFGVWLLDYAFSNSINTVVIISVLIIVAAVRVILLEPDSFFEYDKANDKIVVKRSNRL